MGGFSGDEVSIKEIFFRAKSIKAVNGGGMCIGSTSLVLLKSHWFHFLSTTSNLFYRFRDWSEAYRFGTASLANVIIKVDNDAHLSTIFLAKLAALV